MYDRVDLIDVSVHATLCDHLAGNFFGVYWGNFEQSAQLLERYVVVKFTRGQEIVLDDGAVENRRTEAIGRASFLVRLQQSLELLELGSSNYTVEIHFLEDRVSWQLLTSLVLEKRRQHATSLLS